MNAASPLRQSTVWAALAIGVHCLIACGASSAGTADASGGAGTASAVGGADNAGGNAALGRTSSTSSAKPGATGAGGANTTTVNPSCVADGACSGSATCNSACQNDTALSFSCSCTDGVYVCDTSACNRPNPCRSGATCSNEGDSCTAPCSESSSNPAGRLSCTCRAPATRVSGFAGGANMPRNGGFAGMSFMMGMGGAAANQLLFYTECNEATACTAVCAEGAQTAGASCTAPGQSCIYTNAQGATITCDCAVERGSGAPGSAGAGSRTRDVWTCR